jgi:predicted phosphoribosyltransferase
MFKDRKEAGTKLAEKLKDFACLDFRMGWLWLKSL